MHVVWKFEVRLGQVTGLMLPRMAQILRFGLDPLRPHSGEDLAKWLRVWARCNPNAPKEERKILIVATGAALPDTARYIGTVIYPGYAWHAFEVE